MKNFRFSIIFIVLIISLQNAYAKKFPVKFGKVPDKVVKMETYKADTSAVAVILCDYGLSEFQYTEHSGFNIVFSTLIRIKILKKEGYAWAKKQIYTRSRYDDIHKLRANTYTLEGNKVVKTKLEKSQIYREEVNKYWEVSKFEMSNVKVGSVIEIEYTINSNSYHIREWAFQSEIPTKISQYIVEIPEYFHYKQLQKGYHPITFRDVEEKKRLYYIYTKNTRPVR